MKKMIDEFRTFISRGSVVDLAVGIIVGGAFTKIVNALVNDLVMPLLGLLTGKVNINDLKYVIVAQTPETAELSIRYGSFIQTCVDFFIIAFSVFIIIKLLNSFDVKKMMAIVPTQQRVEPPKPKVWRTKSNKRKLKLRRHR